MKSLFKKRHHNNEEMTLQITSMADIFTILLVFLLKSYSTSALAISPSNGLQLPQAQGAEEQVEALKIQVSASSVEVEGQPAASLASFAFDTKDLQNGASQSLKDALEKARKRQMLIAQSNTDVKIDSKVIVVADQHAPYATLKTVLASAALEGYTDFKLAVVKGE
jgi:biopolymer transport protein ExbD